MTSTAQRRKTSERAREEIIHWKSFLAMMPAGLDKTSEANKSLYDVVTSCGQNQRKKRVVLLTSFFQEDTERTEERTKNNGE